MKRILSLFAIVTVLALLCGAFAAPAAAAVNTDGYAAEVVRLVNVERAKEGLPPLAGSNSKLNAAALQRAKEHAANKDLGHMRPGNKDWYTVLPEYGVSFSNGGENLAWGSATPAAVVGSWMASPGHKANIMDSTSLYNWTGVGVCECDGVLYWAQLFVYTGSLVDDGDYNPPGAIITPGDPGTENFFTRIWSCILNIWNSVASFFRGLF